MPHLAQDSNGNYRARKRLPDDVREEYGRLFGAHHEAKFAAPKSLTKQEATRRYGEWRAEVEGRIDAIRKQRKGEGRSLTHRQARALAGEWYDWFIARHPFANRQKWETLRADIFEVLRDTGRQQWASFHDEKPLTEMHPILADAAETSTFLAMKGIVLDAKSRDQFLNFIYEDLAAALKRLSRISEGDYGRDEYRWRFPKFEGAGAGEPPTQLFEKWVAE